MSLFTKLGETISGSDDAAESDSEAQDKADASDSDSTDPETVGPNFMPSKQKELYLTAYANAKDLSDTGVCSECGTTLSPIKAERLFASCKNQDCENHLREKEIVAVKRYEDRHGVPEDVESEEDSAVPDEESEGSALDGLSGTNGET